MLAVRRAADGAPDTRARASSALSSGTFHPLAYLFHVPPSALIASLTGYVFPVIVCMYLFGCECRWLLATRRI